MTRFNRAVWRIMPPILRKYYIGLICKRYNCKVSIYCPWWSYGKCYVYYTLNTDPTALCVVNPRQYPEVIEKTIMEFSVVETFR
jgi:hypothetical protein